MAVNNTSLYPPTIEDKNTSIFQVLKNEDGTYRGEYSFNISLSKFNKFTDFNIVQISVEKQKSGVSVVNKENESKNIYRRTGTILILYDNKIPNTYTITNEDLLRSTWEVGEIYKIQIRVGKIGTDSETLNIFKTNQQTWINNNGHLFTEWSTIHTIKAIGEIVIKVPEFNFDSSIKKDTNTEVEIRYKNNTLNFYGTYEFKEGNSFQENLYSYRVKISKYNTNNEPILLEDSKVIYANSYYNLNRFNYFFKSLLEENEKYRIDFIYNTENGYSHEYSFNIKCTYSSIISSIDYGDLYLYTPEARLRNPALFDGENGILKGIQNKDDIFSVSADNEEGRISLKLYKINDDNIYNGNLIIKRTDSKSNFMKWENIKILNFVQETFNTKDVFYDYTIESGIFYRYGIQEVISTEEDFVDENELFKTDIIKTTEDVVRDFEYSYLLGEDNTQLKLKFNNDMSSFKINFSEGRTDTIGGKYPFITKNGNTEYKTFPVNGLISFNMDDRFLFGEESEIYNIKNEITGANEKNKIKDLYTEDGFGYNDNKNPWDYDYIYEVFFREKVLNFLHDGKPKLFKSPTEGNIIIRLLDVNLAPQQNLSRKIYSFSSTGYEIDEATMENYLKYNFYNKGKIISDFSIKEKRIGQLIGDFPFIYQSEGSNWNILSLIYEKYDFSEASDMAGFEIVIDKIQDIEIEFNSPPYVVEDEFIGYCITYNSKNIRVPASKAYYKFDSSIVFDKGRYQSEEMLYFRGPSPARNNPLYLDDINWHKNNSVNATINFIYYLTKRPVKKKEIESVEKKIGIGQYYESVNPETSIFNRIKQKYEYSGKNPEGKEYYIKPISINSINIEANPGATFYITDFNDPTAVAEEHIIGKTGNLTIDYDLVNISKNIIFKGYTDLSLKDAKLENRRMDILVDYCYTTEKGIYSNE